MEVSKQVPAYVPEKMERGDRIACNTNNTKIVQSEDIPLEVQKRSVNVVGLIKMKWPLFSKHLIHHLKSVRREKQEKEKPSKHLACKLAQLQINELSTKQKEDKGKTQVPVITVEQMQTQPAAAVAPQR